MLKTSQYCITTHNLQAHELIGLTATVTNSTDTSRVGLKGKIIDETKNTLVIETNGKNKIVPKKEVVLKIQLGEEQVVVGGKSILFRPEDRTKKRWRATRGTGE